jgi:uncharacterized OB-fold protein
MAYLPATVPGPEPTIDDRPFWHHCQARELRFQRCAACRRLRHPPTPACPHCRSRQDEWIAAGTEAELYSFTVVHHPAHEAVEHVVPYNVAIVRFRALDDLRLVSNVVDCAPAALRIGMRLALVWERAGNGLWVPRFRPA